MVKYYVKFYGRIPSTSTKIAYSERKNSLTFKMLPNGELQNQLYVAGVELKYVVSEPCEVNYVLVKFPINPIHA